VRGLLGGLILAGALASAAGATTPTVVYSLSGTVGDSNWNYGSNFPDSYSLYVGYGNFIPGGLYAIQYTGSAPVWDSLYSIYGGYDYESFKADGTLWTYDGDNFNSPDPETSLAIHGGNSIAVAGARGSEVISHDNWDGQGGYEVFSEFTYGISFAEDVYASGFGTPFTLTISMVPEPASWGLMILGLGGVGALMRRRPIVA
jgi:hypothetical protein